MFLEKWRASMFETPRFGLVVLEIYVGDFKRPPFFPPPTPPQLGINTPWVTYAECLVRDLQAPRTGERSGGNPLNYLYARAGCRDYANCVGYYNSRSITPVIPPPPTGPHKS